MVLCVNCVHQLLKLRQELNIHIGYILNSVDEESDNVEVPAVAQEEEKPKSETGKAIERERDAAIKRKTLALEERMNDFKEMLRERAVCKL